MNGKVLVLIGGIVIVAIAAFGIVTVNKTNTQPFSPGDTLRVASTIFPLHDIVRTVAGENVESNLILPPGASPHLYQFTPSTIREIEGSHLVFTIGHGLDEWVHDVEDALPNATFLTVDSGIALREMTDEHGHGHEEEEEHHDEEDEHGHEEDDEEHHDEEDDHHDHGPIDPHYWLSFANAKIIAQNVADALSDIDPDNRSLYEANAAAYIEELTEAEQASVGKIASFAGSELITFHDAWYYFADDINVEIVGTFEPSAGEEPTPRFLAELTKAVEEHNVRVIFSEPQIASTGLESFARDNRLTISILDPLGGAEERTSYIELMEYNINQVVSAFSQ